MPVFETSTGWRVEFQIQLFWGILWLDVPTICAFPKFQVQREVSNEGLGLQQIPLVIDRLNGKWFFGAIDTVGKLLSQVYL